MGASLRRYWDERAGYQTFLYGAAVLLLASGVAHTVVFLVDGGSWHGPLSWRKPILFGFSFGITVLSVAWVLSFLPRRRRLGWLLAGVLGVTSVAEVFLITMQRWRGVPSHFNEATTFDTAVFRTMGGLVAVAGLVIATVTVWSFRSLRATPSMAWAIRVGLVLLVASQLLGGAIIANGLAKADAEAVAAGSTFGAAGGIKVPHAVSLHAVQLLPALAWLLGFTAWAERRRAQVVLVAAAGYLGLFLVTVIQTFSGVPTLELDAGVAVLLAASALALAGPFVVTMRELARRWRGTPPPTAAPAAG
jgi:hypothetical protein